MDLTKYYILWRSSFIDGWFMKGEAGFLYDLASKYITQGGLAVEIGSWKGKSGIIFARICQTKKAKFIAVDTFSGNISPQDELNQPGGAYFAASSDPDKFFRTNIFKNLRGLPVTYLKMTSHQATREIKNQTLDFCFIDGDHTLPVVLQDINDYLPKVKSGGMLSGHDYSYDNNPRNKVRYAVDKVLGQKNIKIFQTIWLYVKP